MLDSSGLIHVAILERGYFQGLNTNAMWKQEENPGLVRQKRINNYQLLNKGLPL